MSFKQFLRILLARKRTVLWTMFLFLLVAVALSVLPPKRYTASASVIVDFKAADASARRANSATRTSVLVDLT